MERLKTHLVRSAVVAILALQPGCGGPTMTADQLADLRGRAAAAQNAGDYATAEALHRQVVDETGRTGGRPPGEQALAMINLASVLNVRGNPVEALALLQRAETLMDGRRDVTLQQRAALHVNMGKAYALLEEWDEGERRYREGIAALEAAGPQGDVVRFNIDANLAYVYWKTGRTAEARELYEKSLAFFHRAADPDHPVVQQFEREYAALLADTDRGRGATSR